MTIERFLQPHVPLEDVLRALTYLGVVEVTFHDAVRWRGNTNSKEHGDGPGFICAPYFGFGRTRADAAKASLRIVIQEHRCGRHDGIDALSGALYSVRDALRLLDTNPSTLDEMLTVIDRFCEVPDICGDPSWAHRQSNHSDQVDFQTRSKWSKTLVALAPADATMVCLAAGYSGYGKDPTEAAVALLVILRDEAMKTIIEIEEKIAEKWKLLDGKLAGLQSGGSTP